MDPTVLAEGVARCAHLPAQLANVGGMLHVARLHVLHHVALVMFGVAAVQAGPA